MQLPRVAERAGDEEAADRIAGACDEAVTASLEARDSSLATLRGHVQGLLGLRKEALVRAQPEPLDGGDEAAVRAEPPARPRPPRRQGPARLRLHPLPQGWQGAEGSLITAAPARGVTSVGSAR